MDLDGCHMCKSTYPVSAMTVTMNTDRVMPRFEGRLNMVIHAAKRNKNSDGQNDCNRNVEIQFEDHEMDVEIEMVR